MKKTLFALAAGLFAITASAAAAMPTAAPKRLKVRVPRCPTCSPPNTATIATGKSVTTAIVICTGMIGVTTGIAAGTATTAVRTAGGRAGASLSARSGSARNVGLSVRHQW